MTDMKTCVLKFILISAFVFGCFLLKSKSTNLHRSDSDVINPEDKEELCQPKTRIAFAKTHKTGSSTIQVKLKIDLLSFEIFSEHSLSLWRFQPASLCASKLCLRSWQASATSHYLNCQSLLTAGEGSTFSTCPNGSIEEWSSNTRAAR